MVIEALEEKLQCHLGFLEKDADNINLQITIELLRAQILHHQQKLTDAITLLTPLFLRYPLNDEIAGLLAVVHFDHHDIAQADLFAQKTLELNPKSYEGLLVQMLLRALKQEVVLTEIESLSAMPPHDSRTWFVLGIIQLRAMNIDDAEKAFQLASIIWPQFHDNWICMGWCHLLQNNLEKAASAYQQAVDANDKLADGMGGIALVCALQNDAVEHTNWLQQADAIDPNCFLSAISRIIMSNQLSANVVVQELNPTFQKIAPEINWILCQAMLAANIGKTFH